MKVLLVGGGGREHALGWKIAQSPQLSKLYLIPGNTGLEQLTRAPIERLDISQQDIPAIVAAAHEKLVGLVVVGPEMPLAEGLADALAAKNIPCFGPGRKAAMLESSKGFMKELCSHAAIPTARYARFSTPAAAKQGLDDFTPPYVIKADGLAAGKGVIIAPTFEAATIAIDTLGAAAFGDSTDIIIEEFLEGEEASFFVISDGHTILPLIAAQDYKRVGEGDTGPNTGGMGACCPAPAFTKAVYQQTMDQIITPTITAMAARGTPFCGVLFAGLMITDTGPKLIEYNVRFGDPECQLLMRCLQSDLLPVLHGAATATLAGHQVQWSPSAAALIVLASKGYPGAYEKGSIITGIEAAAAGTGVEIFHAGTSHDGEHLRANGGRVLNITAMGDTITEALERAYKAVDLIDWPQGFCRRDIGARAKESG